LVREVLDIPHDTFPSNELETKSTESWPLMPV